MSLQHSSVFYSFGSTAKLEMYPLQTIWFLVNEDMCINTTTGFRGISKGPSL